jgi:hypothetical protein
MALVTEFCFIGMTTHAGIGQAHLVTVTVLTGEETISVTDYHIAPVIEQIHVIGLHELSCPNTFFSISNYFRIRGNMRLATDHIVPDREGYQNQKYDQAGYYFSTIMHPDRPPFPYLRLPQR